MSKIPSNESEQHPDGVTQTKGCSPLAARLFLAIHGLQNLFTINRHDLQVHDKGRIQKNLDALKCTSSEIPQQEIGLCILVRMYFNDRERLRLLAISLGRRHCDRTGFDIGEHGLRQLRVHFVCDDDYVA